MAGRVKLHPWASSTFLQPFFSANWPGVSFHHVTMSCFFSSSLYKLLGVVGGSEPKRLSVWNLDWIWSIHIFSPLCSSPFRFASFGPVAQAVWRVNAVAGNTTRCSCQAFCTLSPIMEKKQKFNSFKDQFVSLSRRVNLALPCCSGRKGHDEHDQKRQPWDSANGSKMLCFNTSIPGCGELRICNYYVFLDELGNAAKKTTSCNLKRFLNKTLLRHEKVLARRAMYHIYAILQIK